MWDTLYVVPVKSKVKISQNFVAFSEYMNFTIVPFYDTIGIQGFKFLTQA